MGLETLQAVMAIMVVLEYFIYFLQKTSFSNHTHSYYGNFTVNLKLYFEKHKVINSKYNNDFRLN